MEPIDIKIVADASSAVESANTVLELKKAISSTQNEIDKSDFGSQKFKDLSKVLDDANKKLETGGSKLKEFTNAFGELGSTIPGVSGAMKVLNLVLDANPFGLLALAVTSLVGVLSQFEGVTKPIANVMAGIDAAFKAVIKSAGQFAKGIGEFLIGNFSGAYDDLAGAVKNVGNAYNKASDASDRQHKLDEKLIADGPILAQQQQDLDLLKEKGRIKDKDQRNNQLAAIALEKKIMGTKKANAQEQYDIIVTQNKLLLTSGKLNDEEAKKEADAHTALINVTTEGNKAISRTNIQYANENLKDQKTAQDKLTKETEKHQKDLEKLTIEYADTEVEKINDKYDKELALLKKSDKDYNKIKAGIEKERKKKLDEAEKKVKDKETKRLEEIKKNLNQHLLAKEENIVAESKIETDAVKNSIEETKKKYDDEIKKAGKNKDKIAQIEVEKAKAIAVLRGTEGKDISIQTQNEIDLNNTKTQIAIQNATDKAKAEAEQEGISADQKAAIEQNLNDTISDLNQKRNDQNIKLKKQSNKQIADLTEQSAQDQIEASKKVKEAKEADEKEAFSIAKGLMGALSALDDLFSELQSQKRNQTKAEQLKAAKEEFKIKKAMGIVNAAINTAEGITQALTNPFPLNIVMAALAGATGAVQIATIAAKKFDPSATSSGGSAPSAPSAPSMGSSGSSPSFQPSNFQGLGQSTVTPQSVAQNQQVFVTTTSINNAQSKVAVTQGRTKIG